ncbi:MAG: hypothetical protein P8P74_07035 [Crocinitomicaceae bacterium]|nr:hypothetical protein [Crocinitomicaceae bacterium]
MNSIFHRAKHWQLFVTLVGGACLFMFVGFAYFFSSVTEDILLNRQPRMSGFFLIYIPMMVLALTIIFGWQWSIGSGLKHLLPKGVRMNFKLFRAFMIVPLAFYIVYIIFLATMFTKMESMMMSPNPIEAVSTIFSMWLGIVILLPIGLFATFCMFYNFYYCAKTLKSIELGYEAQLNDYIGYFFLFWFNFVGFWIIQPSVNRITSGGWVPPTPPPGYGPQNSPDPTFDPIPIKEEHPRGELLKTKNHEAFEHDDDFEGLF